jgi:photosystem II stability/assembly factor-like uncharacterized protein
MATKSKTPKARKASMRAKAKGSARTKSRGKVVVEREHGPVKWIMPTMESAYARLSPTTTAGRAATTGGAASFGAQATAAKSARKSAVSSKGFKVMIERGAGQEFFAQLHETLWLDRLAEYKRRKADAHARGTAAPGALGLTPFAGPTIPGAKNWTPLGPSVVMNGQAVGLPPVGGRVSGIAVAPGGNIVYVASANGGVFRSDDAGVTWRSCMDSFDVDPEQFASTSLACGAIAIDQKDPKRVYVGTGEGDTWAIFRSRIINALPAYRGIGPIRSDDGGVKWAVESVATGSPALAGQAFFSLAVHPTDRENVVAATSNGLYQRVRRASGAGYEWVQRRTKVHSSVVVASKGATTKFFAADWSGGVVSSADGHTWQSLGTGFPKTSVGRIALGVQANNPNLVYAVVTNPNGILVGVYRLDAPTNVWKRIANPPNVLPAESGESQGDYDLCISVDPTDANIIYLGGSYANVDPYPASIWRCKVVAQGSGYRMDGVSIGTNAHSDVHVLVHAPGDPNSLWVGCDGGAFLNRDPRVSGVFKSRNNGLSCLCTNFFSQHPTDPGVLIAGLQDNGTARATGGPIWKHVAWGDGGYTLINWADPRQVLAFQNGNVLRATDGGQDHSSFSVSATAEEYGWSTMTEPVVGTPYNPARPADAKVVALGSGKRVYVSKDFGKTWPTSIALASTGSAFALAFASPTRLYVGTTSGEVFRLDAAPSSWTVTPIHTAPAGTLPLTGLVSDVTIDWSDTSGASLYIAFGGSGDYRHVWHFNGSRWDARSGAAGSSHNLLDVEHNALVVDRQSPQNLYVGADIGVWHSPDKGATWEPLPNGLPDAPVFDLQIHPTRRLLRASTHGRGLYEYPL